MSKTYFIAGGLGLIGWQLVKKIINENEKVIILDKKDDPSEKQCEFIKANAIPVLNCNARDTLKIKEFINHYHNHEGEITGLVNLLAFYEEREKQMQPIETYLDEVWEAAINVNINDTYRLTKVFLEYFLQNKITA